METLVGRPGKGWLAKIRGRDICLLDTNVGFTMSRSDLKVGAVCRWGAGTRASIIQRLGRGLTYA